MVTVGRTADEAEIVLPRVLWVVLSFLKLELHPGHGTFTFPPLVSQKEIETFDELVKMARRSKKICFIVADTASRYLVNPEHFVWQYFSCSLTLSCTEKRNSPVEIWNSHSTRATSPAAPMSESQ